MGPGYKEEVYERALLAKIIEDGIAARNQVPIEMYQGDVVVALFYLDLFVEEQVVVEVKAFPHQLTNDELGQVILSQSCRSAGGLAVQFWTAQVGVPPRLPRQGAEPPCAAPRAG